MASDAHAHPADLAARFPGAEEERRRLAVSCGASAWNFADFERHEAWAGAAREEGTAPMALCFAVHPQLPGGMAHGEKSRPAVDQALDSLFMLAGTGRLHAIGETGFDLYNQSFRDTEKIQEELFTAHLELAIARSLPLILHIRRAMHKVFAHGRALARLSAVVFHSFSGTLGEGEALLRRGINAYFSFGGIITLNHKTAMEACARLPLERLLTETDAPYQPPRGVSYSCWADLDGTLGALEKLRRDAGSRTPGRAELEAFIDETWRQVFFP